MFAGILELVYHETRRLRATTCAAKRVSGLGDWQMKARYQRSGNEEKASSRGELTMLAVECRESLVHFATALRVEQP